MAKYPHCEKLWIPGNIGTRAARAAHLQQRIEPISTGPMTLKVLLKWSVALSFVSKQSTSGVVLLSQNYFSVAQKIQTRKLGKLPVL